MATPDHHTTHDTGNDLAGPVYGHDSALTGWFVGIIVAIALLAVGYLVFSANDGVGTASTAEAGTAIEAPIAEPASDH